MKEFEEMNEYDGDFKSMDKKVNLPETERNDILHRINSEMDRQSPHRKKSLPWWKSYLAFSAVSFLVVLLILPLLNQTVQEKSGALNEKDNIQQVMETVDYDKIIHQEEVENGAVVFYTPQTDETDPGAIQLRFLFIRKTQSGWEETNDKGGYSSNIDETITSQYVPGIDSQSPFPMLYGESKNPEVTQLMVTDSETNKEYQAAIISTENVQLWFAFLDGNQTWSFDIEGLSDENEVIASVSSEDGEVESGWTLSDEVAEEKGILSKDDAELLIYNQLGAEEKQTHIIDYEKEEGTKYYIQTYEKIDGNTEKREKYTVDFHTEEIQQIQ